MSEPNLNDILSGGGVASLLSNPDIAAKLPKIMEALGPIMAEMREGEAKDNGGEEKKTNESVLPINTGKSRSNGNRIALLKALEPYLSDNRREAMEYIMKVTSLIDLLSGVM